MQEDLELCSDKSIFCRNFYETRNILSDPFKRFEDMQMLRHTKTLGVVQVDEAVRKHLSKDEKAEMGQVCEEKLEQYFARLESPN